MRIDQIIIVLFIILSSNSLMGQHLPIDKASGEVVYTDMIKFDTLTPDTAFSHMMDYLSLDTFYHKNIQVDTTSKTKTKGLKKTKRLFTRPRVETAIKQ